MHHCNKSDLLDCIESYAQRPANNPEVEMKIFDGAALIHTVDPHKSNGNIVTFDDYANKVVIPYLVRHFECGQRVDVVWDEYKKDRLKSGVRNMRGTGSLPQSR